MTDLIKTALRFTERNASTILTGVGVMGVLSSIAAGITVTPQACKLIDLEKEELAKDLGIPKDEVVLPKVEVVTLVWKLYIPTAVLGALTIGSIIWANRIGAEKAAALAGLYAISEKALKEYQEQVVKEIGEKREQKVKDDIAQNKLDQNPVNPGLVLVGEGETLVFDSLSGRYFKSSMEQLRRIQNDFNRDLLIEDYMTLNQFYDAVGLEHTSLGDDIGWSTEFGLLNMTFSAKVASNGKPCLVLGYAVGPQNI